MTKKIIMRGPFLSQSGYGVQSRFALSALRKFPERFDIYLINTPWGRTSWTWEDTEERRWIDQILQKTLVYQQQGGQFDISLQVCIPNEWKKMAPINIGYTAGIETTKISPQWFQGCFNVNKILLTSNHSKFGFTNAQFPATDNVTGRQFVAKLEMPMEVVPYPVRIVEPKPINVDFKYDFNFLTVAQWGPRKNVENTIKWFVEEFMNKEVGLILKVNSVNQSLMDREMTQNRVNDVLSQFNGKERKCAIHLLHGDLREEEMTFLYRHPKIKAFISLTHGEGFCGLDYTPIITDKGLKKLIDIKSGDLVLTHRNRYRKVITPMSREYSGEMIKIVPYCAVPMEPIVLTPNHNVYIYDNKNKEFLWKRSDELKQNDYLVLPKMSKKENIINNIDIFEHVKNEKNLVLNDEDIFYMHSNKLGLKIKNNINIDKKFGRLCGWFLAEGCVSDDRIIAFSLHDKEIDSFGKEIINCMKDIFGIEHFRIEKRKNKKCSVIVFHNKIVALFFKSLLGNKSKNKVISDCVFSFPNEFKEGMITALFEGDGYINTKNYKNPSIEVQLVNKTLLRQIRILLLEQGILCSYKMCTREGIIKEKWNYKSEIHSLVIGKKESINKFVTMLNKHTSNTVIYDTLQLADSFNEKQSGRTKEKEDCFLLRIKNITKFQHAGKVFNLSVEEDETYCTENFMVHNCLPMFESAYNGLPIVAPAWSGQNDFIYMPIKDKKKNKIKNTCMISNVAYDIKNVQPEAVWDGIIIPDAQWCFPREIDAKQQMREVYKNYGSCKSRANKLQEYVLDKFDSDKMLTHFADCVDEYYPIVDIADFLKEEKEVNPLLKEVIAYD